MNNSKNIAKRTHTCPVVYLQNFSKISQSYYDKLQNFNENTYREPKRKEFTINVHDKITNSAISLRTLQNIGVRNYFYSPKVENYLRKLELKVGKQFKKIRRMTTTAFIDLFPIFRYLMSQLIRTPKFQQKIRKDQLFLLLMDDNEFKESLMKFYLVQKPKEVTKNSLKKIHEDFILNNLLETIFKWSTITLMSNSTNIPFITSDSPVVYNNAEFFPSYLSKENHIEFSMIFNPETAAFYFPIDPRFSLLINRFDNQKNDVTIREHVIFDNKLVMTMNMLEYQYSERFIYLKDVDEELVKNIRKKCGNDLNKEYQLMEDSYKVLREEIQKNYDLDSI